MKSIYLVEFFNEEFYSWHFEMAFEFKDDAQDYIEFQNGYMENSVNYRITETQKEVTQ